MITLTHAIYSATVLGKRKKRSVLAAIVAGAIAPDIVMALFFLYQKFILGTSSELLWKENYPGSYWADLASWFHSIPIVTLLLVFFWWRRNAVVKYFFASWLIHLASDLIVHHSDAHMHFLPLTTWRFFSPISYWESAYHGTVVGAFALTSSLFCLGILWGRYVSWWGRIILITLALLVSFILGAELAGDTFCPEPLRHFMCSFG